MSFQWNPIAAILDDVKDVAVKYIGSESDRMKMLAELAEKGQEHSEKLAEIQEQGDDSARQMQIATKSMVPPILAILITLGFFSLLGALFFWTPPKESRDILNIMLGSLGTAWVAVVHFYFNGGLDSQAKSDSLAAIAKMP